MAFNPNNLVQWNVSPVPPHFGLPQWWGYLTSDTIATVQAADYFDLNPGNPIGRNTTWFVGDQVYCVCSDGVAVQQISAVTPHVTTTASSAQIPAGSITHAMLGNNIVDLNNLAVGITPSDIIKFAAQWTTVGGAAAEVIPVAGAVNTDGAFVQLVAEGTNNVSVKKAVVTANTLTVTFSADPGNNAIINYQLIRIPT